MYVLFQGLDNNGAGYHIHVYPLPYQYTESTDLCGASSTGGHFSPFATSVGSTQDVKEVYNVPNLTLGQNYKS